MLSPADRPINRPLIAMLAIVFGGIFFVNEQNFDMVLGRTHLTREEYRENSYTADIDDAGEHIASGSALRRVAFPLLGLIGGVLLLNGRRRHGYNVPVIIAAMLFYGMCLASVLWSEMPNFTAKRVIVLGMTLFGLAGLARSVTLRELIVLSAVVSTGFVLASVLAELKMGMFTPWQGNYRFAGMVHPNTQASYCATMALSLFGLAMMRRKLTPWLATLLALSFAFMFLTKSRSTMVGVMLSMFVAWFFTANRERRFMALVGGPLAALAIVTAFALSSQIGQDDLGKTAALGREDEQLGGLNGRVPLWWYCLTPISRRPAFGYGYDSFWSPDEMQKATAELSWTIPNSHNVLIEVQLNLGLVGLILFVTLTSLVIVQVCRRLLIEKDMALTFPVAFAIFGVTNSIFEAAFSQPSGMETFFAYCSLVVAVMLPSRSAELEPLESSPAEAPANRLARRRHAPLSGWGRPSLGRST
ncbi:MAG: O-antigen ligase family protein [Planctomycetales bacterium]|nr:O-antigen ligase family protein [Planctomycetales bacterium]